MASIDADSDPIPDPAYHCDVDPGYQNDPDPGPQHWLLLPRAGGRLSVPRGQTLGTCIDSGRSCTDIHGSPKQVNHTVPVSAPFYFAHFALVTGFF